MVALATALGNELKEGRWGLYLRIDSDMFGTIDLAMLQ